MSEKNQWSDSLQKLTRDSLYNLDPGCFMRNSRCHLKHIDDGFGFITLKNALAHKLLVESSEGVEPVLFATVDDLVDAGWALD